eukprot:4706531-Pyramimonas_sp.AAC.1
MRVTAKVATPKRAQSGSTRLCARRRTCSDPWSSDTVTRTLNLSSSAGCRDGASPSCGRGW